MCSQKGLPKKSGNMKNETTAIEEEIKDRIAQGEVQGRDVEYWKVLDRIKIVRIKG
jgi:translation initiation factor 5A